MMSKKKKSIIVMVIVCLLLICLGLVLIINSLLFKAGLPNITFISNLLNNSSPGIRTDINSGNSQDLKSTVIPTAADLNKYAGTYVYEKLYNDYSDNTSIPWDIRLSATVKADRSVTITYFLQTNLLPNSTIPRSTADVSITGELNPLTLEFEGSKDFSAVNLINSTLTFKLKLLDGNSATLNVSKNPNNNKEYQLQKSP